MMRFAIVIFLAFTGASLAQGLWFGNKAPGGGGGGACTGGYLGPGDQVSAAAAWWGLRSYSCAYATGVNKAITIRRASDNTTADVLIKQNGSMDTAAAATFCNATTCFAVTLYDQSGNGSDATQGVNANQPQLIFSCIGALPCLRFSGSTAMQLQASTASLTAVATLTGSLVGRRTGNFNGDNPVFGGSGTGLMGFGDAGAANTVETYAGTRVPAAATDNVLHALQFITDGVGTSSLVNVDGIAGGTGNGGHGAWGGTTNIGEWASVFAFTGDMSEGGFWTFNFSGAQQTSMCHNQYTYWGLPNVC